MPYIYRITNIVTQDCYIGKTKTTLKDRLKKHIHGSRYGVNTHLCKAIRKYGEQNFVISLMEEVGEEELNDKEKLYIQLHSPRYNMTEGGDGGDTSLSPNFIKSMKQYHSKKDRSSYATYGMKGKNQSDNAKKLISEKNSCPVMCEGVRYESVAKAQEAYPGIAIRKRLGNPKYPNFYRLKEITRRK